MWYVVTGAFKSPDRASELSGWLVKFPQSLVENHHCDRKDHDGQPSGRQSMRHAEAMRGRTGEDVSNWHCAYKGKDEHTHDSATHLIGYQFLEQRVCRRDGNHN